MKHFQIIYDSFDTLGICPSLLHQSYPFNEKTLKVYCSYWLATTLFCVYFWRNTNDVAERLDIAYRISVEILIIIYYTIFWFKMGEFFQILDMCEKIIDKSKRASINDIHRLRCTKFSFQLVILGSKYLNSKSFYNKIGEQIQKWSEILYLGIMKISLPVLILPKIMISIYMYMTMHWMCFSWENDAIELPFQMW